MTAPAGGRLRSVSLVFAALAGAVFGAGLLVSGMTQPARVIGFLDFARDWDPTLVFVMGGAASVYAIAYNWLRPRRAAPWFEAAYNLPIQRPVDRSLVAGAAVFGIGWGIGGLCPGPGLVTAITGGPALAFILAMVVGTALGARYQAALASSVK